MADGHVLPNHISPKCFSLVGQYEVQNENANCKHVRPSLTNFRAQHILQKHPVVRTCYRRPLGDSICCYDSLDVIRKDHHQFNLRLLAAAFFWVWRICMFPLRRLWLQFRLKISSRFRLAQHSFSGTLFFLLGNNEAIILWFFGDMISAHHSDD